MSSTCLYFLGAVTLKCKGREKRHCAALVAANKKEPRRSGTPHWPAPGDHFLLGPEPDEPGELLSFALGWFALGWLAVDELPLCDGD